MNYLQSYYTDIGNKRKTNQDSLAIFKAGTETGEILLSLICDGMGGYQSGEIASKTIVESFEKWFKQDLPLLLYNDFSFQKLKEQWVRLINECNGQLVKYGAKKKIDLGSTLTACLFTGEQYYCVHVGDSRAYKIRKNEMAQITMDQSVVADAVRRGEITEEEAKADKRKNILLECIGITKTVDVLFFEGEVSPGDSYLLCSDGLWHYLKDEELMRYLWGGQFKENKMIRMHLNCLVETVKERGEKDNISAISVIPYREE